MAWGVAPIWSAFYFSNQQVSDVVLEAGCAQVFWVAAHVDIYSDKLE